MGFVILILAQSLKQTLECLYLQNLFCATAEIFNTEEVVILSKMHFAHIKSDIIIYMICPPYDLITHLKNHIKYFLLNIRTDGFLLFFNV